MDFSQIKELMDQLNARNIPKSVLENFELTFDIEYAHHSTAMEGNTLTLVETKAIIEEGISVGGKKLREIYEVARHLIMRKKKLPIAVRWMKILSRTSMRSLWKTLFRAGFTEIMML